MNPGRWLVLAAVAAAAIATGVILFQDSGADRGDLATDDAAVAAVQSAAAKSTAEVSNLVEPVADNASREAVASEPAPGGSTPKKTASTSETQPGRTIAGRVVDDAGRPVKDADVEMISFGAAFSDAQNAPAPGRTDANGNFAFTQRGDGSNVDRLRVRSKQFADGFAPVPKIAGKVDVGTIVVEAGGSVMGRVLETSGNPVAKAKVTAYVKNKDQHGTAGMLIFGDLDSARSRSAISDSSGAWRIDGLPAGEVALSADADGFAPETLKDVKVEKLKVTSDLVMNLSKGATIEGLVLDATGRPLAGAEITVSRQVIDLNEAGASASFGRNVVHTSDANGRFQIEGLRDEPYSVGVRADGYLKKYVERVNAATTDLRVQLQPSGVVFGVVTDAQSLKPVTAFEVSTQDDGFGFTRFSRAASTPVLRGVDAANAAGIPQEPGLFAVTGLEAETVTLHVTADGYAKAVHEDVRAASGQKTRIDIVLTPEITVSGIVRAPDKTPVEGAVVTMIGADQRAGPADFVAGGGRARLRKRAVRIADDGDGPKVISDEAPKTATTGADGTFTIRGLATGDYSIRATHTLHAGSEPTPVSLEDGDQIEDVDLRLRAGGSLVGAAFDQYGKPLAGATVRLSAADTKHVVDGAFSRQEFGGFSDEKASATSDEQGNYAMRGVLPGDYIVRVSKPSSVSGSMMISFAGANDGPAGTLVSIHEGETTTQDVSLPPTGDIAGTITEAGRPVKSARVTLSQNAGMPFGEPTSTTDEDGKYAIREVKPGAYTLRVSAPKSAVPFESKVRVDPKRETTEHVKLPSGAIRGRVIEQDTNAPLAGIVIDVRKVNFDEDGGDGSGERPQISVFAISTSDVGGGAMTMKFGNESDSVVTDADGNYEVSFLAPAEYKVSIRGGGIIKMENEKVLVPESGAAEGIDFRAAKGATLSVVADLGPDPDDEGDAGSYRFVEVTISPADNPGERDTQAEVGSGACVFPGLKPGRYLVEVKASGKQGTQLVDIESGEQKKISVPVR